MSPMFVTLVSVVVVMSVGLSMLWTPRLTRPGLWFAVTVDRSFAASSEAQGILRTYRRTVWLALGAGLAVVAAALLTRDPGLATTAPFLVLAGSIAAFLRARRRALAHAAPGDGIREAELTRRQEALPGGVVAQVGPFALLAAAAAWVGARWSELPARFPIHWDLQGQPNGWATRSLTGVFGPVVVGAGVCALLGLLALALRARSRRVSVSGAPGDAELRFRRTVLAVFLGAEYLIAVTFAAVTALPVLHAPGAVASLVLVLTVVVTIGGTVALIRLGQGGARLVDGSGPAGDRTLDAHWRWGMFYVNRADPALFVEKRFGIGYTVNLGNRWAWVFLAGSLVPFALSLLLRAGA